MRASGCEMIVKIVVLFLVAMGVLAMFGKLKYPGQKRLNAARCPGCGRIRIGKGPCACGKGKRVVLEWFLVFLGLVILLFAGDALVRGAVNLSLRVGIPAFIVSLTVVAFGTSAPELLISVSAVMDGLPGLEAVFTEEFPKAKIQRCQNLMRLRSRSTVRPQLSAAGAAVVCPAVGRHQPDSPAPPAPM